MLNTLNTLTTKNYTYLLNKPYSVTEGQAAELESILTEFPYLQSARAIYLKALYNKDSFRYNDELKKTAAYTTDRSVLFEFITTELFRSIDLKQLEEQETALAGIEVVEDIVAVQQPATDKLEESIKLSIIEAGPEEKAIQQEPTASFDTHKLEESIKLSITEAEPEEEATTGSPEKNALSLAEAAIITDEISVEQRKIEPAEIAPVPEEKAGLAVGSPLKFDIAETHSFAEWLQLSRLAPIQRKEPASPVENTENQTVRESIEEPTATAKPSQIDRKLELIDRFIEINPKIKPVKSDTSAWENLSKTTADSPGLMTETLARVYLEQKKYTKAIQAYEILILKYPEKSAFFADRISEIKDLQ